MDALNPHSPIPLYRQLADILTSKIRKGEFPEASRIPSEHQLAQNYGIGRPTARQATDQLVLNGTLVRRRGAGTFVRSAQKEVDLFSFAGTISSFRKKGIAVQTRIIQKIRLKKIRKDAENSFAGKPAYFYSRLSLVDDMPVLIEDMYLNPTLFSGIDGIDMTGRSLSQIVDEKYYLRPTGGKQNFRIVHLTGKKATDLSVSSEMPILLVKRFLDFPSAENAIFSELFCRTDKFVFSQIIGGGTIHET